MTRLQHSSRDDQTVAYEGLRRHQTGGLKRSWSSPDLLGKNKYRPTSVRAVLQRNVRDTWSDYWWENRGYDHPHYWPHYGFPYRRYWHQGPRTSSLAHYPSLSWVSRFAQYDKLDPVSWRRYRQPLTPSNRWHPFYDRRFELRMSCFDSPGRVWRQHSSAASLTPYQPRIWYPSSSCWTYSYHYRR